MRSSRRAVVTLACAVCLAPLLRAQQQAPTFRTSTALVTVDVAVFDGDGKPVPGLTADAFAVTLNGKPQPIKALSYVQARSENTSDPGSVPEAAAWDGRAGRQVISNEGITGPRAAQGEDRVFVILVDDLSIPPTRGQRLLKAAREFVASVPAADPVGVVHTSAPGEATQPTLDRKPVLDALARISGSAISLGSFQVMGQGGFTPVGLGQAVRIDQGSAAELKDAIVTACFGGDATAIDGQVLDVVIANDDCAAGIQRDARILAAQAKQIRASQLSAFEAVIAAMGTATGIRHLVILSDGLTLGREADAFKPVAAAAARAGVQVSVLMEEHDMHVDDQATEPIQPVRAESTNIRRSDIGAPQRRLEDQRLLLDGLQTAATMLGGQFYRVVGDPMPFFERVRTASAAIYRLGVELPAGLAVGQELAVDASVKHPGASVYVSRHSLVPEPTPVEPEKPKSIDDRLTEVLSSGQQHGAVPLRVATLLRRAPTDPAKVEVTINLAAGSPGGELRGPLTTMFGVLPSSDATTAGATMTSGRLVMERATGVVPATFGVPLAPGSYALRVAVADAEGALGAVATELDASLLTVGPFTASDLLVAWVDDQGRPQLMALDSVPATATGVRAELELYPPASGVSMDTVQVELTVTKAGERDPLDERIVTPRETQGVWRAATEFAADLLESGRYVLRARVIVGADAVGSVVSNITVAAR
ncbi:MAG: hypothetical protein AMXMBFR57_24530 [Acidimicrobiia bacterium]